MGIFDFMKKKQQAVENNLEPPQFPSITPADVNILNDLPDLSMSSDRIEPPSPPSVHDVDMSFDTPVVPSAPVFEEAPHIEQPLATDFIPSKHRAIPPMFVSVQDYQEIISNINYVRQRFNESHAILERLNEIKVSEEKGFDAWRSQLEDLQRKIAYVENVIAEAK